MLKNNTPFIEGSRFIIMLAMLYCTASITADVVAYKFAYFFGMTESGATIIFPITYVIGDVICEVYGWRMAMKVVWLGLFCEVIFAAAITLVIHLPSTKVSFIQHEYIAVLGNLWLFVLGGIIANAIAGFINVFLISKWKILTKGKIFWVRSILSTCISEFVLILVVMLIAFVPVLNMKTTLHIFIDAYVLEIFYAVIFVLPAQLLVNFLKKQDNIDAFDHGTNYNPFKV